jgi:serine-type D-Ala-D-Ala carboxypeptidase/endopeptidase (penicillin-binding protein 4)
MLKKYLLLILTIACTSQAFSQLNKGQIKNRIDTLLKDEFFNSTTIAVDIYDLTLGEYLYQLNENKLLNPASNMKLLTSAAGLIFLGPEYKYFTTLKFDGDIRDSILFGDLYVVGGFDPDFKTDELDKFVNEIRKLGIKEISGNLFGDVSKKDSLFRGWGWMWDDDPSTDAPYLSPLNINGNSIDVFVTGSTNPDSVEISTNPQTNYIKIINNTFTSTDDSQKIKITRNWLNRKNEIIVSGNILSEKLSEYDTVQNSLNLYRPDLYFLTLLKEKLENNGIKVDGKIDSAKTPVNSKWITFVDRSYDSVMVYMNKHSDNLSAEMTLYSLAALIYPFPVSAKQGTVMVDSLLNLCGPDSDDYVIADGSGVSRYNLLSAEDILSVLKFMYSNNPDLFSLFFNSLPVAGVDGTLEERMIGTVAEGMIHAKTGTLRGVSCLSGYSKAMNNHLLAFSVMEENFIDNTKFARNIQDQICILLSRYK